MIFSSSKRLERGRRVLVLEKGKRFKQLEVTKWRKSHIETYQNTQICYEREEIGEDSARSLLEDFQEVF